MRTTENQGTAGTVVVNITLNTATGTFKVILHLLPSHCSHITNRKKQFYNTIKADI